MTKMNYCIIEFLPQALAGKPQGRKKYKYKPREDLFISSNQLKTQSQNIQPVELTSKLEHLGVQVIANPSAPSSLPWTIAQQNQHIEF